MALTGDIDLNGARCLAGKLLATVGLRLAQEEEFKDVDQSIYRNGATPDREVTLQAAFAPFGFGPFGSDQGADCVG